MQINLFIFNVINLLFINLINKYIYFKFILNKYIYIY